MSWDWEIGAGAALLDGGDGRGLKESECMKQSVPIVEDVSRGVEAV